MWVEYGRFILPEFARYGWISLFYPLQGYEVLATRLLTILSLQISFLYFPIVSMALTVIGTAAVIFAIIFAPTELRLKPLCALSVLLIPSDPEVFGVGEYIFWWAGILLLLALVWRQGADGNLTRYFMIIIGGLSAPIIIPMASLMVVRAWVYRASKPEVVAGGLAVSVALIQIVVMLTTTSAVPGSTSFAWLDIAIIVRKFFGLYAAYPFHSDVVMIVGTIFVLIIFSAARTLGLAYQLLVAMLIFVIATIAVRIPVSIINPFLAGPRYFFYPFVITAWLTLWVAASHSDVLVRSTASFATLASVMITLSSDRFSRRHDPIDWKEHVRACMQSETYDFPIHFDGALSRAWRIKMTGQACRDLAKGSLIGRS